MRLSDNPRKYFHSLRLALLEESAFRISLLLGFLQVPVLFLIYSAIWQVGFATRGTIHGYTFPILMTGLMTSIIIRNLLSNTTQGEVIESQIQKGTILIYLARPISYFWYQFTQSLARLITKGTIGIPAIFIIQLMLLGSIPSFYHFFLAVILMILGVFVFFELTFISAIASFWIGESWGLRNLIVNAGWLLGGAIVPISFFPPALQAFSNWFPFQYMIFTPSEILMGRLGIEAFTHAAIVLLIWSVFLYGVKTMEWHAGLRHHDGKG